MTQGDAGIDRCADLASGEGRAGGTGRTRLPGDGEEVLDGEAERLQFREGDAGAGWRWSLQYLQEGIEGGSRPDEDPAAIVGEAHDGGAVEAELMADACRQVDPVPLVDGDNEHGPGSAADRPQFPATRAESASEDPLAQLPGLGQAHSEPVVDPADGVLPGGLDAGAIGLVHPSGQAVLYWARAVNAPHALRAQW